MNKLVGLLAGTVLVTGSMATYLWLQLRAERTQGSAVSVQAQVSRAHLTARDGAEAYSISPPRPTADAGVLPGKADIHDTPASLPADRATPLTLSSSPENRSTNPSREFVQEMMSTPDGQQKLQSMRRSMISTLFPDLDRELGMSPVETERFFDLLAKQQNDLAIESVALMNGSGSTASTQALQLTLAQKQQTHEAELAALLGDRYPRWLDYKSSTTVRRGVNELRSTLSSSGIPMTDAQTRQLIKALAAEAQVISQEERNWMSTAAAGSPDMMRESMQRSAAAQRRLIAVAANYLTPAQTEKYRQQVEQQLQFVAAMTESGGVPRNPAQQPRGTAPLER